MTRYAKSFKELNTLQQRISKQKFLKVSPPFYQHQMKLEVDESKRLKDHEWPFMANDKVRVLRGKDAGKIGKIERLFKEGNSCFVKGLGESTRLMIPPQMWTEGQTSPLADVPSPIHYKDLQLVVKYVDPVDRKSRDVAVHSVVLEGKYYDKDYHKYLPIRRLEHDRKTIIPWPKPLEPLEESSNKDLATSRSVVEQKSYEVVPLTSSPVPLAAWSQLANLFSKHKAARRKITAEDLARVAAPQMPVSAATLKLRSQMAEIRQRQPSIQFTKDMQDFIGEEIEKGLHRRKEEETSAWKSYL